MRDNSGKGDSRGSVMDPTIKEHQAAKGRSGQAPLEGDKKSGHKRTPSPDGRGGGGR